MQRLRDSAGFTLIEIMVVVFILGLLVTLVAAPLGGGAHLWLAEAAAAR